MPARAHRQRHPSGSLLLLLLAVAPLQASDSATPRKIGLALSGGGARGAAHIGVLKILEREKVPIHCIAGTSFGAVVGGLYSLGYSASEIEKTFTGQDWGSLFSDAPERRLSPINERRDYRYLGQVHFKGLSPELPTGLKYGQKIIEALSILTVPRQGEAQDDFDRLPIPFRAVATDLETGGPYLFRKGSLAEAMRASIAIPLFFTPVEREGRLLVDGGLADNLPTDVVRDMGADIIIAVDVTTPLLKKDEIRSLLEVMDQSLSLLMKRSVEANAPLATIIIRPDLTGISFAEYERVPDIIARGEQAGNGSAAELRKLAQGAMPPLAKGEPPSTTLVESVELRGLRKVRADLVRGEVRSKPGETLQPKLMLEDMRRLYATRLFDSVYSSMEPLDRDRSRLVYQLGETSPNTLGASLRYDRDYHFIALMEGTARQLFGSPSSATLSSQFGGIDDHSLAFRFVPASLPQIYIEPKVHYRRRDRQDIRDQTFVDRFADRRIGGQLSVGGILGRGLDVQVAFRDDKVTIKGGSAPNRMQDATRLAGVTLRIQRDTLDAQDFPGGGGSLRFQVDKRSEILGSDLDYLKMQADWERYQSVSEKSTLVLQGYMGLSRGPVPFFDRFYAGGLSYSEGGSHRLLGFSQDEILAKQIALFSLGYRREIFSNPLSFARRGFLKLTYNGIGISERDVPPYQAKFYSGGGVEFALDTMLGPMRLSGGWGEAGRFKLYLTLGPSF